MSDSLALSDLKIARSTALPLDAVTSTFAIIGVRGSGKTNTSVVMVEELLGQHQQVCVMDPVDVWYGLRSSKDGTKPGLKIVVIGGPHGDLPLTADAGVLIADFLVENRVSVVLSLRHLSKNDQRRFSTDFAERLYFLKANSRTPLHLVLDEADRFIPQRIVHGMERLLGAFDDIVRLGRSCGLGITLISQRPQVINKDVLTQMETLICHRIIHKLDRKAVLDWVEAHDVDGQGEEMMKTVASLERGEAWVWSPSFLDIFKRFHVRERRTFDSSFTPKAGVEVITPTVAAKVDLDELKKKLEATIQKAKLEDPAALRRQIDELQAALELKPVAVTTPIIDEETIAMITEKLDALVQEVKELEDRCNTKIERFKSKLEKARDLATKLSEALLTEDEADNIVSDFIRPAEEEIRALLPKKSSVAKPAAPTPKKIVGTGEGDKSLPAGERAVLVVLAQRPEGVERPAIGVLSGYSKKSTRDAYIQRLTQKGFVTVSSTGRSLVATSEGIKALGAFEALPTGKALRAKWVSELPKGEGEILELLCSNPAGLTRAQIGEISGYEAKSTRDAYIQRLCQKLLVSTTGTTVIASSSLLK